MKVMFKHKPQMQYDVLGETDKEYNISVLGWIPKEELVKYDHSLNLPHIIDVYIEIENKKKWQK